MKLDTSEWKAFKVGELFELIPTRGKDSTELLSGDDISYIGAKKNDNGLIMRCQLSGFEDWISKGNCIVFICLGAGSAGYATYQPDDFIGMNGKTICGYNEHLNDKTGNFIATVLSCERPKYSFGRSWTGERLQNTIIKLPATSDGTPDWDFMESYMKTLHHKPLTTKNKPGNAPELETEKWGKFKVGELFDVSGSNTTSKDDLDCFGKGMYPYITTSAQNNGVEGYYDYWTEEGSVIAVESACMGYATYQPINFSASDHVELLKPKFRLNEYIALFIVAIINMENYKYSYGRKCNQLRIRNMVINLPITPDGDPDWQFMEDYIKALPYGDRL